MAIIKRSKNMIIKTTNKETIICGKRLEEIATSKWVEAMDGKLVLNSPKKIHSHGNRK
ncbi:MULTISPECIES: hypothetical protein [Chryseobacterium]|uniref:hypothetical protein n=1 Tax=Chryseobacterium TaxID=59732 RepID=UPI0014859008|nr:MULTISPECIES: hypothetical protein [unclassified Chryseobacterium]